MITTVTMVTLKRFSTKVLLRDDTASQDATVSMLLSPPLMPLHTAHRRVHKMSQYGWRLVIRDAKVDHINKVATCDRMKFRNGCSRRSQSGEKAVTPLSESA